MSDLTQFRDHARRLSTAEHGDACEAVWHETTWYGLHETRREKPDPHCPGCVTASDRTLWSRLADEVDAYLTDDDEQQLDLGSVS